MKNTRKIVVLICGLGVIYTISAASSFSKENQKNKTEILINEKLNAIMASDQQNECLDAMMTEWFESFNTLQESGLSMLDADNRAAEMAVDYFTNCN